MVEVEMKFPVGDFHVLERRLAHFGAREALSRQEIDKYFNAPDRDFAQTDEAFRLRRIGELNFATYKGPKRDLRTKTRTELEVPLGNGNAVASAFSQLLVHLGYRPVAVVRKQRRIYHLEGGGFALEVCLDIVEGLGQFAEVEAAVPEERLEAAQAVILEVAAALGLTGSERRSYLQLLLEKGTAEHP